MDIENGTHEYYLKKPIKVHFVGKGETDVICLVLQEPGRHHAKKASRIRQMVMKCFREVSTDDGVQEQVAEEKELHDKTSEEMEESGEGMKEALSFALMLSDKVDLGEFVETFIEMCLSKSSNKSIILCDGDVPIKDAHFDQMSADTIEEIAIVYASFFLMPSVIRES